VKAISLAKAGGNGNEVRLMALAYTAVFVWLHRRLVAVLLGPGEASGAQSSWAFNSGIPGSFSSYLLAAACGYRPQSCRPVRVPNVISSNKLTKIRRSGAGFSGPAR